MLCRLAIAFVLIFGVECSAAYSAQLDPQQITLRDTAAAICDKVKDVKGEDTYARIKREVKGQLSGLRGHLLGTVASASGTVVLSPDVFGALTEDAAALAEDRECRTKLFEKMFDKIAATTSGAAPAEEARYRAAQDDPEQLRAYARECKACVYKDEALAKADEVVSEKAAADKAAADKAAADREPERRAAERKRLEGDLAAAAYDREALNRFLASCGVSCPADLADEAHSRVLTQTASTDLLRQNGSGNTGVIKRKHRDHQQRPR